ncbi:hypothetical protein JAAARDRAFT_317116 [Jaapia argillacea MUCL 33604]|uniref:Uncharacterized protein n=1 Tax=Jaapia argillacea MUCL 33604 TaxID=933084 RepID=A0A067PMG8_9AGAM|nr:hypothetical protein JAAARDRAFT_317116 [Jaapia argillacea MUCL 33604]
MAALYLHNALFSPEASSSTLGPQRSQSSGRTPSHQRQPSAHSIATLTTVTTHHSHPTEPLLHSNNSVSSAYHDLLSRQPSHPSGPQPGWDSALKLEREPVSATEARGYRQRHLREKLKRWKIVKVGLEVLIGGWAIYNTVRYFITFATTPSSTLQIYCLVLGTCTAFSLALLLASTFLYRFAPHFWTRRPSTTVFSLFTQFILPYCSSVFLFGPALVNLVLVCMWKGRREDAGVGLEGRCRWDIDVVWEESGGQCSGKASPAWGIWLGASIARLCITLVILCIYHFVSYKFFSIRHPPRRRTSQSSRRHSSNIHRRPSASSPITSPLSPSMQPMMQNTSTPTSPSSFRAGLPAVPQDARSPRQSSITIVEEPHFERIPSSRSLRSARSRIASTKDGLGLNTPSPSHHRSSWSSSGHGHVASSGRTVVPSVHGSHEDLGDLEEIHLERPSRPVSERLDDSQDGDFGAASQTPDEDLISFVDRFRAMVTQVTRETEEGLEFARGDDFDSADAHTTGVPPDYEANPEEDEAYEDDDEEVQYEEFPRRSFTPEDHVRMLGGFVRRMPTIESLSSREVMSSVRGAGSASVRSLYSGSRPPTRANTINMSDGWSLSQPPSRSNSLNWRQLEALSVNEMGEVVRDREPPSPSVGTHSDSPPSLGRTGTSYYTAGSDPGESPISLEFGHHQSH